MYAGCISILRAYLGQVVQEAYHAVFDQRRRCRPCQFTARPFFLFFFFFNEHCVFFFSLFFLPFPLSIVISVGPLSTKGDSEVLLDPIHSRESEKKWAKVKKKGEKRNKKMKLFRISFSEIFSPPPLFFPSFSFLLWSFFLCV